MDQHSFALVRADAAPSLTAIMNQPTNRLVTVTDNSGAQVIEPRLLLQSKTRMVIRCINKAGVKMQDMDPYDLFDLLFS